MSTENYKEIMNDLGKSIYLNKQDMVDLLDSADVDFDLGSDEIQLIDAYVDNLFDSDKLMYGTSYIVNLKNSSNFNGTVDNESVYGIYDRLYDYWENDTDENGNDFSSLEGDSDKKSVTRSAIIEGMLSEVQREKSNSDLKLQESKNKSIFLTSALICVTLLATVIYLKHKSNE